MKVQEIKKHIDNGHHVTINNGAYKLIKDNLNQYLIICLSNDYCIGLTDSKNNLNMDYDKMVDDFDKPIEIKNNKWLEDFKKQINEKK